MIRKDTRCKNEHLCERAHLSESLFRMETVCHTVPLAVDYWVVFACTAYLKALVACSRIALYIPGGHLLVVVCFNFLFVILFIFCAIAIVYRFAFGIICHGF